MADIVEINDEIVDDIDTRDIMHIKTTYDILKNIKVDEDEKLLMNSIILGLEEDVANYIKNNKIVSIPNIGICRKKLEPIELRKHNTELRLARKTMSKEDYKSYARDIYRHVRSKVTQHDCLNKLFNKYRSKFRKKYNEYAITRGVAYANVYIKSILWLEVIDFNQEIQDQYDKINGRYIE